MSPRSRHQRKAFGRFIRKNFGEALRLIRAADKPQTFSNWLIRALGGVRAEQHAPVHLPLKDLRLRQLHDAGFNCADFRSWHRDGLVIDQLQQFYRKHGSISLRNFTEERESERSPRLPVAYEQTDWELIEAFCRQNNASYHTLVNEALPLAESLYTGNIVLLDDSRYVATYFEGYGTPRDVDVKEVSHLRLFCRKFGEAPPDWALSELVGLEDRIRTFLPRLRPITLEFSIYPAAVGMLKRPEVFWEWRGGSAYDLYTVVQQLLQRSPSHELILDLP